MKVLTDDDTAISFESAGGTVRLLRGLPMPNDIRPEYSGAGQVRPLWGGVVLLAAFAAERMTRAHMRLVVRLLREEGYTTAYVDRLDPHSLPMATRIESGDFAGLWRVDLTAVPMRRRSDHPREVSE